MRGTMRSVVGMRDECLHMRVINLSALCCPRNFADCTEAVVCTVTELQGDTLLGHEP